MSFLCWCACKSWLILLAFTSNLTSLVEKVKALCKKHLFLFQWQKDKCLTIFLAMLWIILLKRKHYLQLVQSYFYEVKHHLWPWMEIFLIHCICFSFVRNITKTKNIPDYCNKLTISWIYHFSILVAAEKLLIV